MEAVKTAIQHRTVRQARDYLKSQNLNIRDRTVKTFIVDVFHFYCSCTTHAKLNQLPPNPTLVKEQQQM